MFTFGKTKTESRITGEFYVNAIHVMEGASALSGKTIPEALPQAGPAAPTTAFQVHSNYVALPISEAFRIEYWKLEEAKIRRQPPEKQLSRQIALIVGGGSGIGREVALLAAQRGAHVVVADRDFAAANAVALEAQAIAGQGARNGCRYRHSQSRDYSRSSAKDDQPIRRPRHPGEHSGHFSCVARRHYHGCTMGSDSRRKCDCKLSADGRGSQAVSRSGI